MKYAGAHVSTEGGVENAPVNAAAIGASSFALFLKNQRQWSVPPYKKSSIEKFKENMNRFGFSPKHVLPHDSYLINVGNADKEKRERSYKALLDEANRAEELGLMLLNFHPGSHLKEITEEECLKNIATSMNRVMDKCKSITLVIENTAGQGTNLGYRFEHLAELIHRTEDKSRVGVCLDTCHAFAAGYDLRTEADYKNTAKEFDKVVGFKYLKALHLNDAKCEFASRVDRHHSLGEGNLGIKPFELIMKDKRMEDIPLILETIDDTIWDKEIDLLYSFTNKRPKRAEPLKKTP